MSKTMIVSVRAVSGSAPRDVGARMLVHPDGIEGSIGGGRLEFDAIAHARKLMKNAKDLDIQTVHLGPDIGQCCGGTVELGYSRAADAEMEAEQESRKTNVFVFGAGHVGRAIAKAAIDLPFDTQVVDTRPDFLANLPEEVTPVETVLPEAVIRSAPPRSVYVVVTHDHALDFLIVEEVLRRKDAAYVGMIGSKTKRAVLASQMEKAGVDIAPLTCPIGRAGLGDKRPEVIAAFVVAEILASVGAEE